MTSIIDNDSTLRHAYHRGCGGTVLLGGSGEQRNQYCDRCGAFTYDLDAELPSGTDAEANARAFNDGEERSPEGES